jgi:hypothetical protein
MPLSLMPLSLMPLSLPALTQTSAVFGVVMGSVYMCDSQDSAAGGF